MAIDRRKLLVGTAAAVTSAAWPVPAFTRASNLYASALRKPDGSFSAAIFSPDSGLIRTVDLPGRAHACVQRPGSRECVVFARRPQTFAVAFSTDRRTEPVWFKSAPDRHFYGHGVFSDDGALLFTTENDYDANRGVIGIRDVGAGYRQIGEIASGGIGPHDIAMMPEGRTLVVANGGIETHPGFGREPLNLETMKPNLAYIDVRNGDLLERHQLAAEQHKISIRHLCVTHGGDVVIGCQNKGRRSERADLLFTHKRQSPIRAFALTGDALSSLRNYVSSIHADRSGEYVCATSSRGSAALVLDLTTRRLVASHGLADVSGVAGNKSERGGFTLTTGTGIVQSIDLQESVTIDRPAEVAWDNHLTALN